MYDSKSIAQSAARVEAMAEAVGVSVDDALQVGALCPELLHAVVVNCKGCGSEGECDQLLATRPSLDQAPGYCRNRRVFESLKS